MTNRKLKFITNKDGSLSKDKERRYDAFMNSLYKMISNDKLFYGHLQCVYGLNTETTLCKRCEAIMNFKNGCGDISDKSFRDKIRRILRDECYDA